jgi:uncharacterized membrane protein
MQLSPRLVALTAVLSALTIVLSLLSVPFMFSSRIHFFQTGILLAGAIGGPFSGLITGLIGGLYMASVRSDPTIVIGNGLLGLFVGIFSVRVRPLYAGVLAWVLIQAPWVFFTGTFIFRVPAVAMQVILLLLTVEDIICAAAVDILTSHFNLRSLVIGPAR